MIAEIKQLVYWLYLQLSADSSLSVPLHLLEEIRRQREKLEASLFHNDYIRRQLEGGLSTLKRGQVNCVCNSLEQIYICMNCLQNYI